MFKCWRNILPANVNIKWVISQRRIRLNINISIIKSKANISKYVQRYKNKGIARKTTDVN